MQKTDSELIARFLTGDQDSFDDLLKRYQSPIRQFLRRLTAGDHALADDISQETFIKMFYNLNSFRGDCSVSTWLHTIAYRNFLRHMELVSKIDYDDDPESMNAIGTHHDHTSEILVEQLMKRLSVNERLMVTLSFSVGMSHSEIAEVTGAPLGTIKSHINRGKTKLAELMDTEERTK
jgi:RNA polymerase sigma-70 factor, ECF subfamily